MDLHNIKSSYNLKELFSFVDEKRKLELVKYNKSLQKKLELTKDDYESFKYINIKLTFDAEYVNELKNQYNELKSKVDNKNFQNEDEKKKLNNDLRKKERELKESQFVGLPFFTTYKQYIKIYYNEQQ